MQYIFHEGSCASRATPHFSCLTAPGSQTHADLVQGRVRSRLVACVDAVAESFPTYTQGDRAPFVAPLSMEDVEQPVALAATVQALEVQKSGRRSPAVGQRAQSAQQISGGPLSFAFFGKSYVVPLGRRLHLLGATSLTRGTWQTPFAMAPARRPYCEGKVNKD